MYAVFICAFTAFLCVGSGKEILDINGGTASKEVVAIKEDYDDEFKRLDVNFQLLPGCHVDQASCYLYSYRKEEYCKQTWIRMRCGKMCDVCSKQKLYKMLQEGTLTRAGEMKPTKRCGNDNIHCNLYEPWKGIYCRHNWLKRNCRNMCDSCSDDESKDVNVDENDDNIKSPLFDDGAPVRFNGSAIEHQINILFGGGILRKPETPENEVKVETRLLEDCEEDDHHSCSLYKKSVASYCIQGWVKNNCKHMCDFCKKKNGHNKDGKSRIDAESVAPKNKECESKSDHTTCSFYKKSSDQYCRQPWVKRNCQYLCGTCKKEVKNTADKGRNPVKKTECERKSDHTTCSFYKKSSDQYCRQPWVKRNCQYLCGVCKKEVKNTADKGRNPVKKTECRSKRDLATCSSYAKSKKRYCIQPWIKRNCQYMCGVCKREGNNRVIEQIRPAPNKDCNFKDDHTTCLSYEKSKAHYCTQPWIKRNCQYMCGVCRKGIDKKKNSLKRSNCYYKDDHSSCSSYKKSKRRYCIQPWIKRNCQYMCGVCKKGMDGRTKRLERPAKKIFVTPNTKCDTNTKDHSNCSSYAKQKTVYCRQRWVRKNCKELCGGCRGSSVVHKYRQ